MLIDLMVGSVGFILLLSLQVSSLTLSNDVITITFGEYGIARIDTNTQLGSASYSVSGDDWEVVVGATLDSSGTTLGPAMCPFQSITAQGNQVLVRFGGGSCFPYAVNVTYELQDGWHYATKTLLVYPDGEKVCRWILLAH